MTKSAKPEDMHYPTKIEMRDLRWMNDDPKTCVVLYTGFPDREPIEIPMYKLAEQPGYSVTGHLRGAPHEGDAEDAYARLGGQAALLRAADRFANRLPL
jgi:hypothetical protein